MNANWKAAIGVLLVFILGLIAGALITTAFFKHRATQLFQRGAPALVEVLERRMTRNLGLTPDQKTRVHQYLMENLEERRKLQAPLQPAVQQLNRATVEKIAGVLRPDQAAKFRENLSELRQRFPRPGLNDAAPALPAEAPATNAAPAQ